MLKKFFLLIAFVFAVLYIKAQTVTVDGMTFTIVTVVNKATLTSADNDIENAVIPSSVEYNGVKYPVTDIGTKAFFDHQALVSVYIPETVTEIWPQAFFNCISLTDVTGMEGVTTIDDDVFARCFALEQITLPQSLTSLGQAAFILCTNLKSIVIPPSVGRIRKETFNHCYALESVTLSAANSDIAEQAFAFCLKLTSITIPENTQNIGSRAFYGCDSLETLVIKPIFMNSIFMNSIGEYAFAHCPLKDIYCNCLAPPTCGEGVFSDQDVCTLHVNTGCQGVYKTYSPWRDFSVITEDYAGISDITTDENHQEEFYNLDGRKAESPQKGSIVIRKSGNEVRKILVK